MASRIFYAPHVIGNKPLEAKFNSISVDREEPKIPYTLIKVTEIRRESRYVHERIDPASRRRQKVKAIRTAFSNLWKALQS